MRRFGTRLAALLFAGHLLVLSALAAPAGTIIWGYQEGMAKAQSPDGTFGFANPRREIVIPMIYDSVLDFNLGLAQVQLDGRLGVIRQDGTYLIAPEYDSLYHMDAGLYIAQKGTKWGVVSLLPFSDGAGGLTQVFYDFVYDSAQFTQVGGMDTLVLTQGEQRTLVPYYQITQLMLERQVPSARFPLTRGLLPNFSDVSPRDWFDVWVDLAYNLGLMEGTGEGRFSPHASMTVAEALQLAAEMESRQTGDNFHTQSHTEGGVWYRPAVDYCIASGIIGPNDFSDYTRPVTRAQLARIFSATSLARSLPVRNDLEQVQAAVPDVQPGDYAAGAIYDLYAKGILAGTDGGFTFSPNASITRAEAAAMAARLARAEQRLTLF